MTAGSLPTPSATVGEHEYLIFDPIETGTSAAIKANIRK